MFLMLRILCLKYKPAFKLPLNSRLAGTVAQNPVENLFLFLKLHYTIYLLKLPLVVYL